MQAKVKDSHRWKTVVAFSGHEFVKGEWRSVPAGFEKDASEHPMLEVMDKDVDALVAKVAEKEKEFAKPTAEAKLEEMASAAVEEMEALKVEEEPPAKKSPAKKK